MRVSCVAKTVNTGGRGINFKKFDKLHGDVFEDKNV